MRGTSKKASRVCLVSVLVEPGTPLTTPLHFALVCGFGCFQGFLRKSYILQLTLAEISIACFHEYTQRAMSSKGMYLQLIYRRLAKFQEAANPYSQASWLLGCCNLRVRVFPFPS